MTLALLYDVHGNLPALEPVQRAARACAEALGPATVARLAGLPPEAVVDGVRYVHGTPGSDLVGLLPQPAEDEDALLADVREQRLVAGHTHLPFERTSARGIALLNPGSVGMPLDGDVRAAYALLHDDGRVERRRVAYAHDEAAAAVRARFTDDWTEVVARRLETGRFDPDAA